MTGSSVAELRDVRLLGLPLDILEEARQRQEELMREFSLITLSDSTSDTVPARLLQLIDVLQNRYSSFAASAREQEEAARERGDRTIDLRIMVPQHAADAAGELDVLLDEADEFCRQGDLLTLAAPEDLVALRKWYLGEFRAQLVGEPPTSWAEFRSRL